MSGEQFRQGGHRRTGLTAPSLGVGEEELQMPVAGMLREQFLHRRDVPQRWQRMPARGHFGEDPLGLGHSRRGIKLGSMADYIRSVDWCEPQRIETQRGTEVLVVVE